MARTDSDVTALLGSRICHDLISPLGAISNGVELMRMAGGEAGPELDLIAQSVDNANARIRYFRIAFGAASPDQMFAAAEARRVLADVARSGRLAIDWRPDEDVPRPELKLTFLLLQCLENAMPWGGTIEIERRGRAWAITGRAERMQIDPGLWGILSTGGDGALPAASEVQFALAPDLAEQLGRSIAVTRKDGEVVLRY